ncbi:solute carrier family 25 member 45 isoform X3 [Trachemys scripta elegans]|uniref:solute carrier family 25 member 45 isoform X3 n=1 Tax=Trachemys scripta elegans TaxID=31138 RepID=UPI0015544577|nr:solute carrier family 25 member 45 isoform X3 [Trachemys scripta elegans]
MRFSFRLRYAFHHHGSPVQSLRALLTMPVEEFVAGWISGAVGLALGHPVDTVKVRLQTQSGYRGILDCMIKTYRNETAVVLAPIDLIKVRLQNQLHSYGLRSPAGASGTQYRGPVHCAASIFHKEGVMGLFRGTWALVLRDTPTMAIYFLTYTSLCQAMTVQGREPGPMTVLVAGGCAGTASWILATPMDVIKARLQMDGVKGVSYHGVLDCIRISVRHEGPQVFLKGLALNCIRAFPVNAVTFLSYETILKLIC